MHPLSLPDVHEPRAAFRTLSDGSTSRGRARLRRLLTGLAACTAMTASVGCQPEAAPAPAAEVAALPGAEDTLLQQAPPEAVLAPPTAVPAEPTAAAVPEEVPPSTAAAPASTRPTAPDVAPPVRTAPPAVLPNVAALATWLSGASGTGVANGALGAWRGRPLEVAGSWSDDNANMVEFWQLQPGAEFGSWNLPMDVAIGAIGPGETWSSAAVGAYDARWRASLTKARDLWAHRPGTLFIRFAHEMNGNWYPWSVDASESADFIQAWQRFRALQQEIYPASQLVFCVNRESVGTGIDWRQTFPGAAYVDVMGVDYYNQYPYVATAADWAASLDDRDQYGSPKGLSAHLEFARANGLPLAVPEWSAKASMGDSPAFITGMYEFLSRHGGSGPGRLLYEIQFNVDMHGDDYRMFGGGRVPASAEAYRSLW